MSQKCNYLAETQVSEHFLESTRNPEVIIKGRWSREGLMLWGLGRDPVILYNRDRDEDRRVQAPEIEPEGHGFVVHGYLASSDVPAR